jgi:ABC-type dipeptide/oligopeptide/nickel transport system ATPase component
VKSLLEVKNLRVVFSSRAGSITAVDGVCLEVAAGELVGILGESGSGKTTFGLSLLSLVPPNGRASGSIRYRGRELLALDEDQLEKIRGGEISMIFQEPALTLHPTLTVGEQVADVIRAHSTCNRRRSRQEAESALTQVRLDGVRRICAAYPHQLSGGERRRVAIVQALASKPSLLIADEPTASLDTIMQVEILSLLRDLNERLGIAILLISHDPSVLAGMASRLLVMSSGRIVEQGPPSEVFKNPKHAYTRSFARCVPQRLDYSA